MTTYKVTVPTTREQGSFTCIATDSLMETVKKNALWAYNAARAHDGQAPVSRMPAGTIYKRVRS